MAKQVGYYIAHRTVARLGGTEQRLAGPFADPDDMNAARPDIERRAAKAGFPVGDGAYFIACIDVGENLPRGALTPASLFAKHYRGLF